MTEITKTARSLIDGLGAALDIPPGRYEAAERSYEALGRWLERPGSALAHVNPKIYPQGSFQLGTAIRPIREGEHYDLDVVCEVNLEKLSLSQETLKNLLGGEILAYAKAHQMSDPTPGRRCWRLDYADGAQFHIDILPALPDGALRPDAQGLVAAAWSKLSLSITDTYHPGFREVGPDWPASNPMGFAEWFRQNMWPVTGAVPIFDSVAAVPEYRVRTPLQRAIQILKRHRDLRFSGTPEHRPISVIITTLATLSYDGEREVSDTLFGILSRFDKHIENRGGAYWVANPTDPRENFADKWRDFPERRHAFFSWLETLRIDFQGAARQSTPAAVVDSLAPRLGRDLLEGIVGGPIAVQDSAVGGALAPRRSSALLRVQDAPHRTPMRWEPRPQGTVTIRTVTVEERGYRSRPIGSDAAPLRPHCDLTFEAVTSVARPYRVYWQIVNTGDEATHRRGLRGGFEESRYERGTLSKSESTLYSGTHSIQCFIVREDVCLAQSERFIVNIL